MTTQHTRSVLQAGTVDASKMYLNVLKAHAALREGPLAAALVKNMRAIGLAPGHLAYIQVVFAFCRAGALQVRNSLF